MCIANSVSSAVFRAFVRSLFRKPQRHSDYRESKERQPCASKHPFQLPYLLAILLLFVVTIMPASAQESWCTAPNILQEDGSCYLVVTETTIDLGDLAQQVNVDDNPFPQIYDVYTSGDPNVFVSGPPPVDSQKVINWTHHSRPAYDQLLQNVHGTLAQQLAVPVDAILTQRAHGQLTSLLFLRIIEIINTSAESRSPFEQQVYDEVQQAVRDRRYHIANLAAQEYNKWRNYPCGYKVPVGDPDQYLSKYAVQSYCYSAEAGNPLVIALTSSPAIPSQSYLYWATRKRMEGLQAYWRYRAYDPDGETIADNAFVNAYTETQQALAYHLGWGTVSQQPGFDFSQIYSEDPTLASGLQSAVADFGSAYARDFLGAWLFHTLIKGPGGFIPDLHDLAILAAAVAVHTTLEIVDQVESREGIQDALDNSSVSLSSIGGSNRGRAELLLTLIELRMPAVIDPGRELPAHNSPLAGVFYSSEDPDSDGVSVEDWGADFTVDDSPSHKYTFSDQNWLSRSKGYEDLTGYNGFTSHVRYVTPEGDFNTAWLVKGEPGTYRQFMLTPYARMLRDPASGGEARFRVEQRLNNDCPAKGSYSYNTPPTDNGLSCVIAEGGVAAVQGLSGGDLVVIGGQIVEVLEVKSPSAFTLKKSLGEGSGLLWQLVHKVEPAGGDGTRTDRFEYKTYGGAATAILDFTVLPPELNITIPDILVEATDVLTPVELGSVTATDPTDGTLPYESDAPALFPLGSTIVTYTASDMSGNSASAEQKVDVIDTTPPQFTALPVPVTVEATARPMSVELSQPVATDIFDVSVVSDAPVEGFTLGSTVVIWSATDTSGNLSQAQQTVTVTDTTPPLITFVPADLSIEATSPLTLIDPGMAAATDLFGASISNDLPANGLAVGEHTLAWTAIDGNGNQSQATQLITVTDTTPPEITLAMPTVEVEANAVLSVVELGAATAEDLVDGQVEVSHDAPDAFALGTTHVTYTATDSRGNQKTVVQTVNIVDTTAPVFTVLPENIDSIAEGPTNSPDLGVVEASDIFFVSITNDAPAAMPVGETLVTWTATDSSGNQSTITQTVKLSYQFTGFEKPVEADGVFKVNRVLPLRMGLVYADGTLADTAQAEISVELVNADGNGAEPVVIDAGVEADSGNFFELRGGNFQYNLNTRELGSGVYRLIVTSDDGNQHAIEITLK